MSVAATSTLLSMPIAKGAVGPIFDPTHPHEANATLFRDWEAPLVPPAPWRSPSMMEIVALPNGAQALRFGLERDCNRALVTCDELPDDVTITATLEIESALTSPSNDSYAYIRPWVGIVARMLDVRRYYFFCLEHPDAAALYRREDDTWLPLGRFPIPAHNGHAHELRLAVRGDRLQGWVNGAPAIDVTDYAYPCGKAGVRATCPSKVHAFTIDTTVPSRARFRVAADRAREEESERAAAVPKPVLAKSFDLRDLGEIRMVKFAAFAEAAKPLQMLVLSNTHPRGENLQLMSLDREIIWTAKVRPFLRAISTEPRDDGHSDVFGITPEEAMLLDGRTGTVLARRPLPTLPGRPDLGWQTVPLAAVNLSGGPVARELLLQGTTNPGDRHANDGEDVWALDENLQELWYAHIPLHYGHAWAISACDVNGDGRDEVFCRAHGALAGRRGAMGPDGDERLPGGLRRGPCGRRGSRILWWS